MNFNISKISSTGSLRTADAFPVVASLPPKNSYVFFSGNASAVRRLVNRGM